MKTEIVENPDVDMSRLYTYKYLWQMSDDPEQLNIKIVTDIPAGHSEFIGYLTKMPNILRASREYMCEYDVSAIGSFEPLIKGPDLDSDAPTEVKDEKN